MRAEPRDFSFSNSTETTDSEFDDTHVVLMSTKNKGDCEHGVWTHDHDSVAMGHYIKFQKLVVLGVEANWSSETRMVTWRDGEQFCWELTPPTSVKSLQGARKLTESLRVVSEKKWLAAMPNTTIDVYHAKEAIQELLSDVSLPVGYVQPIVTSRVASSREMEEEIFKDVLCAWLNAWRNARRSGDLQAEKEAVEVLQSASKNWKHANTTLDFTEDIRDRPDFAMTLCQHQPHGYWPF